MRRRKCPHCYGTGGAKYYDHGEEGVPGSSGLRYGPCYMCNGEGWLLPLRRWFLEAAEHMKHRRERRGQSIVESAAELGITVDELATLERGFMYQACAITGYSLKERRAIHDVLSMVLKMEEDKAARQGTP